MLWHKRTRKENCHFWSQCGSKPDRGCLSLIRFYCWEHGKARSLLCLLLEQGLIGPTDMRTAWGVCVPNTKMALLDCQHPSLCWFGALDPGNAAEAAKQGVQSLSSGFPHLLGRTHLSHARHQPTSVWMFWEYCPTVLYMEFCQLYIVRFWHQM